jgi:molybdenum cofactor cytidylyltransferase
MGSGGQRTDLTVALIPAAGKSTRMGRPKLLLPIRGKTVLELVIATLRQAGIDQILVVIGPHVAELAPIARQAGGHALLLADETPDMRATVEHGLDWIDKHLQPRTDDAWLLVPADHPTLKPGIIHELLTARQRRPGCSIFVPTHAGRRGHPTLIAWKHVPVIKMFPRDCGLNQYLRKQCDETLQVPVDDEAVLFDLDTPEDYDRLVSGEW